MMNKMSPKMMKANVYSMEAKKKPAKAKRVAPKKMAMKKMGKMY